MKAEQKPILDGQKVHKVVVNADHPRWKAFLPKDRWEGKSTNPKLWPYSRGKWLVEYVLLTYDPQSTYGEIVADIARCNLQLPDRAIMETILDEFSYQPSLEVNIIGICSLWTYKGWRGGERYPMATTQYLRPNGHRSVIEMNYLSEKPLEQNVWVAVVRRRRVRVQVRLL